MSHGFGRALRATWRARLPDEVGTPPGERRPLVPAWPFAATGVGSLLFAVALVGLDPDPVVAVLGVLAVVPAVLAWRRPAVAGLWCVGVNLASAGAAVALGPEDVAPPWFLNAAPPQLVAAYAIGLALPWRLALLGVGAVVGSGAVFLVDGVTRGGAALSGAPLWAALLAVAGLLGARQADRHARTLHLVAVAEQRRILDERGRIARELHDVVAHHMSVIAVRAASASRRIDGVPDAAAGEFAELAGAAREALGEMRRMLGVLRGTAPADLEPQPDLADLAAVVERTRRAGTPVDLSVIEPPDITPAAGMSAYRIVQEALSNVTKHATGAATRVRVGPGTLGLVIEVTNARPPEPHPPPAAPGHGLAGMQERARLLGGTFEAGPTPSGGFAVHAELPLEPVS